MLLSRLVEYAEAGPDVVPPFYERKTVAFILNLMPDGTPASRDLTPLADPSDPTRRTGARHVVPVVQRSGTAPQPMLIVDTIEYVLGWASDEKRGTKAKQYHEAYRKLIARWAQEEPGTASNCLNRFLQEGHGGLIEKPTAWAGSSLVAVSCAGELLHEMASARRFWKAEAERRKSSGRHGLCLVCGQPGVLLQTIPLQIPNKLVPGATQQASLVSINKIAHAFALQEQLVHSPICVGCGLQSMAALTSLLSSPESSVTYPGQDGRLTWWIAGSGEFSQSLLFRPTPELVHTLLGSATHGRSPGAGDLSIFCALVVGGNISRIMVRDWIESPLWKIKDDLATWHSDHGMVDVRSGKTTYLGVGSLAFACGRWIAGQGEQRGSYADFAARGAADRPDGVYTALLRSALLSKQLPPGLLAHLVHRIRMDRHVDTARAALIRLALRRHPNTADPEVYLSTLNIDHGGPGYLSGRLFALLEDLQQAAGWARGDTALNTTFSDRYFGRAVTNPAVALVAGRRDARAWLKRLRRDKPSWARTYERRLDELFGLLADAGGMPFGAVLSQQAEFILGYHQQRAQIWAERAERRASNTGAITDESLPPLPEGEPE